MHNWLEMTRGLSHMVEEFEPTGDRPNATAVTLPLQASPTCVINDRFRLERKLGEGGMAIVYQATDLENRRQVALKMMKTSLGGTARQRFVREFSTIVSIHHPSCVDVMEYGESTHGPFFTMELFPGEPITCLIGRELPIILDAIYQAATALDFVHSRRIMHRDVKPSNILVCEGTKADGSPGWQVKLTDFGLARFQNTPASFSADKGFAGTLQYCAPEQITNEPLDNRADLYAFGIVCYELLTGRHPFLDHTLRTSVPALIRAQLRDNPPRLRQLAPQVPAALEGVVMPYLAKEIRARPESARPLRKAIAEYFGWELEHDVREVQSAPPLVTSGFVCRSREISCLDSLLPRSLNPSPTNQLPWVESPLPSLIVFKGEPGIGKSSVLRQAARTALGEGAHVYEGRCFDGNVAPFQPIVELLQALLAEQEIHDRQRPADPTGTLPPSTDAQMASTALLQADPAIDLRQVIDNYSPELLRIAPELRKRLQGDVFRQTDLVHETNYIFRAVAAFFIDVATIQPTCICIEDLQWADASTLSLLRHLASGLFRSRERSSGGTEPFPRLIVCCTARTGHEQVDTFVEELRRQQQAVVVPLTPLTDEESKELIALRLNCAPAEVADELVANLRQSCQGNPFFICETVRQWQVTEVVRRGASQWQFATANCAEALPDSVRSALRLRLQGLPVPSQQLLAMAAVIGAILDVDLLSNAFPELQQFELLDAIDDFLHRRILVETGNRLQFGHDLLREMTLDGLTAPRRQSMHGRVARLLEQRRERGGSVSPGILATHFLAAQVHDKGLAYSLEAGHEALRAYALEDAISYLSAARDVASDEVNDETKYRLFNSLGTALAAVARPREALQCYEECLRRTRDPVLRGNTYCDMEEAYRKLGDLDAASTYADKALREVGYPHQPSAVSLPLSISWSMLSVHCLPQWLLRLITHSAGRARAAVAHRAYKQLGSFLCDINMVRYPHSSLMQLRFARRAGDARALASAYARYAWNNSVSSLSFVAAWSLRRATKHPEFAGNHDVEAFVKGYTGVSRYHVGKLDEADNRLRDALSVLDRQGDSYDRLIFNHYLRHLNAVRGDATKEMSAAMAELTFAGATGYWSGIAWGHYGMASALARSGRLDEARKSIECAWEAIGHRHSVVTASIARVTHGFVSLQCSDYAHTRQLLNDTPISLPRKFLLVEFSVWAYPLLVEALLGPRWNERRRDGDARRAWRLARLARFWGWRFPNLRAHGYRVSGRAATTMGKTRVADKFFTKAIRNAEAIGAEYDLARALLDRAAVVANDAAANRQRGIAILERLGAAVPEAEQWQLADPSN